MVCVSVASATGLAQDEPSMAGSWKLDITHSDFGSEPAPRSMAGRILTDTPQMLSYRVHGVDDKGKPFVLKRQQVVQFRTAILDFEQNRHDVHCIQRVKLPRTS